MSDGKCLVGIAIRRGGAEELKVEKWPGSLKGRHVGISWTPDDMMGIPLHSVYGISKPTAAQKAALNEGMEACLESEAMAGQGPALIGGT